MPSSLIEAIDAVDIPDRLSPARFILGISGTPGGLRS